MRGTVIKIATKTGRSQRGQWTLYSFITQDGSGNEHGWVTFGFESPPFKEGDFIEYETETDENGRVQYKKGTGKIVPKPQAAAQPVAVSRAAPESSGSAGASPQNGQSAYDGRQQRVASYDERQTQIVLQHSQEMAIQAVTVLLQNESLPTTGAKTKAGEAKRFEEITAAIDKLTVKYFHDVVTGRLLSTVPDMGVINTAPDAPLPGSDQQPGQSSSTSKSEY